MGLMDKLTQMANQAQSKAREVGGRLSEQLKGAGNDPEWYYAREGQKSGPISLRQLREFVGSGQVQFSDLVWKKGMSTWVTAAQVPELLLPPALPPSLPPPSLPAANESPPVLELAATPIVPNPAAPSTPIMPKPAAPTSEAGDIVAEVAVTYQGGHPEFLDKSVGMLRLTASELQFMRGADCIRISYPHLADILEPSIGEFPAQMVAQSQTKQTFAKGGKFLANAVGGMLGGRSGRIVGNLGQAAATSAQDASSLGPRPKNRLTVLLIDESVKHKVFFDVDGASREAIEEQARAFWMRAAVVRKRFGKPPSAAKPQPSPPVLEQAVSAQSQPLSEQPVSAQSPPPRPDASKSVVVACPKCQSKLRAKQPGIIQCPKCQAKVRVAESLFQT